MHLLAEKVTQSNKKEDALHEVSRLTCPQANITENRPSKEKKEISWEGFPQFFVPVLFPLFKPQGCIYTSLRLTIASALYGCWDALSYTQENGSFSLIAPGYEGKATEAF